MTSRFMGDPDFWAGRKFWLQRKTASVSATPSFSWAGIAGIDRYEIWVNRTDILTARVIHNTFVTDTTYTDATVLDAGEYRVWVRAIDSAGGVSDWSTGVDFTCRGCRKQRRRGFVTNVLLASVDVELTNALETPRFG